MGGKMGNENSLTNWDEILKKKNKDKNEGFIIKRVVKRNGQIEIYDRQKIYNAISGAADAVGKKDLSLIEKLTLLTEKKIEEFMKIQGWAGHIPFHDWLKENRSEYFKQNITDADPEGIVLLLLAKLKEFCEIVD